MLIYPPLLITTTFKLTCKIAIFNRQKMPSSSDHVQQMVSEVSKMMKNSPDRACGTALNWLKNSRSNEEITQSGALLMDMLIQHGLPETFAKLLVSVSSIESGINLVDFLMDLISKIASENKCYDECASVVLILRKQLVNALDQILHKYRFLDVEIFLKYGDMDGRFWLTEIKNLLEKSDYIITLKYGLDTVVDISDLLKASCQCFSSFYMKSLFYPMDFSFSCFSTFSRAFYNAVESNTKPFPISLSSFNQDPVFISVHSILEDLLNKTNQMGFKDKLNLGKEHGNAEHTARHWSSCLLVLKGLHWISKIYQGAEKKFWSALKIRRGLICELLCRFNTGADHDHSWLIKRKDVVTSECRMRLARNNISELKIPNESDIVEELVNWSESYKNLSMAIENDKREGITDLEHALKLVCYFLLHQQHNLFRAHPEDGTRFYPNPDLEPEPYHLICFELLGKVIALALLHELKIGVSFDGVFLCQLAGENIPLTDIKNANPSFYNMCKGYLNMDDDQIPHHFVTCSSKKVSFFERGFISVFGVPIQHLLSFGKLEVEEINELLKGSNSLNLSAFERIFQTNNSNGSDLLILPLKKVRGDSGRRGEKLGGGSFGRVYIGLANDGSFFAKKEILLTEKNLNRWGMSKDDIMREVTLSCQLDHPNIIKYLGVNETREPKLNIFMELVRGPGTLQKVYQNFKGGLQHSQVSFYTKQILEGLKYLHERNVVHRDIKCANILVKENGCIKIIDFGLAKVTNTYTILQSDRGTGYWKAPEVHKEQNYGTKADIWSLGCTTFEMFARRPPFSENPSFELEIKTGHLGLPLLPSSCSENARRFILQCLQLDPKKRPTAAELLEHPFVKG